MAKRVCVFCGDSPVTEEHIFPKWIRTGLPEEVELIHERQKDTGERNEWTTVPLSFTCNQVCGPNCNEGWMSRLETTSQPILKPMITGGPEAPVAGEREHTVREAVALDRDAQTIVARWALKTATMLGYATSPVHAASHDWCKEMYETQLPPAGSSVFIGYYFGNSLIKARHSRIRVDQPGITLDRNHFDSATVAIGTFMFQTIMPQSTDFQITDTRNESLHDRRIWPIQADQVVWPPDASFDDNTILIFADRFKTIGAPPAT